MATREELIRRSATGKQRTGRAPTPQEPTKMESLLETLAPKEPEPPSKLAKALSFTGDVLKAGASAISHRRYKPSNFTKNLMENFREDTQRADERRQQVGMLRLQELMNIDNREDTQRFQEELAGQAQEAQANVQNASIQAQKEIASQRDATSQEIAEQNNETRMAIARLNASVDQLRATNNPAELARVTGVYSALGQDLFSTAKTIGPDIKQFARENDIDESQALPAMRDEYEMLLSTQRLPEQMHNDMLGLWDLSVGRAGNKYLDLEEVKREKKEGRRTARRETAGAVRKEVGLENVPITRQEQLSEFLQLIGTQAPGATGLGTDILSLLLPQPEK